MPPPPDTDDLLVALNALGDIPQDAYPPANVPHDDPTQMELQRRLDSLRDSLGGKKRKKNKKKSKKTKRTYKKSRKKSKKSRKLKKSNRKSKKNKY